MALIRQFLKQYPAKDLLKFTSDLGINPDVKEAVLFTLLGNEAVAGDKTNFGNHPGVPSISMGKISFF